MLAGLLIVHRSGLCLFQYSSSFAKPPLETLPSHLLTSLYNSTSSTLSSKVQLTNKKMEVDDWILEYSDPYQRSYIIIGMYSKVLSVPYMEELFEQVRKKFDKLFKEALNSEIEKIICSASSIQETFSSEFKEILDKCEKRQDLRNEMRKQGLIQKDQSRKSTYSPTPTSADDSLISNLFTKGSGITLNKKRETPSKKQKNTPKKENREWDDFKYSKSKEDALNVNKSDDSDALNQFKAKFLPSDSRKTEIEFSDEEDDYKEIEKKRGFFGNLWSSVAGGKLTKEDLIPAMQSFKDLLTQKNVATEIAEEICQSVSESLVGKQFKSFESTYKTFRNNLEATLTKILTPSKDIDVVRDVNIAKSNRRPYVITMVGVNGVGKSTSLSKIVFWLKNLGNSVMISACDTFRSGAIEQLKIHANCLEVPLFERGYKKDPASIAKEAIQYAKENQIDVVVIDTAGRMQDNKRLMKELATLIEVNKPDLTLFVGEALVGNDGVDQLTTFDTELSYQSSDKSTKQLDGIVLTKYDTIDDKVGSAISMCYSTGHPILFVGVGQSYADLKKLSVKKIVSQLLS